jgi:hypothetical protein
MMEVNMNSTPRTLRFFKDSVEQRVYFRNIPPRIRFVVCASSVVHCIVPFFSLLLVDLDIVFA